VVLLELLLELLELVDPELVVPELVDELSSEELLSSVEVVVFAGVVWVWVVPLVVEAVAVSVETAIQPARPRVAAPAVAIAPRLHCRLRAMRRSGLGLCPMSTSSPLVSTSD
jgi:hypothetical protein